MYCSGKDNLYIHSVEFQDDCLNFYNPKISNDDPILKLSNNFEWCLTFYWKGWGYPNFFYLSKDKSKSLRHFLHPGCDSLTENSCSNGHTFIMQEEIGFVISFLETLMRNFFSHTWKVYLSIEVVHHGSMTIFEKVSAQSMQAIYYSGHILLVVDISCFRVKSLWNKNCFSVSYLHKRKNIIL